MTVESRLSTGRPAHGGNLAWAAAIALCHPQDILDFSASINPLGPPASAIAALQSGMATLRDYPDPSYSQLRAALGQAHQLSPDWILPGNGAAEVLTWAGYEFTSCKAVALPTPAFGDYRRSLHTFGVLVLPQPLDLEAIALGQSPSLADLSTLPYAPEDCGLLINNPHNPTGHLWTAEALLPYVQAFKQVVIDEAFMDFLPEDEQQSLVPWIADYPNLVILRSLTKFYSLPGLRLGYAITHPDRVQRWQSWRDPWTVNALADLAGQAVVGDRLFQQQTLQWLPPARQSLMAGLAAIPGLRPYPGAANYLLVQAEASSTALQQRLLTRHRILVRDCISFPELGDRFFRIAVRRPEENQRLLDGLADCQ
ncbi:MAG: threonine-phosphate decarboxylase [Synechococcales cyanobacterium K44_A2020_017]|nr:threonine-phosphate decarboxylase [Synechococcales cyanobacterium K32_A2020_035]MBF2093150.1 threonine-phosphate decarboxylase [Synechococcales cyanobacterium K44_A2020_017]